MGERVTCAAAPGGGAPTSALLWDGVAWAGCCDCTAVPCSTVPVVVTTVVVVFHDDSISLRQCSCRCVAWVVAVSGCPFSARWDLQEIERSLTLKKQLEQSKARADEAFSEATSSLSQLSKLQVGGRRLPT